MNIEKLQSKKWIRHFGQQNEAEDDSNSLIDSSIEENPSNYKSQDINLVNANKVERKNQIVVTFSQNLFTVDKQGEKSKNEGIQKNNQFYFLVTNSTDNQIQTLLQLSKTQEKQDELILKTRNTVKNLSQNFLKKIAEKQASYKGIELENIQNQQEYRIQSICNPSDDISNLLEKIENGNPLITISEKLQSSISLEKQQYESEVKKNVLKLFNNTSQDNYIDYNDLANYEVLNDYENYSPIMENSIYSNNKPEKCSLDCECFHLDTLGEYSFVKNTWKSECKNRSRKIECDHLCYNNLIQTHQEQINLIETKSFGINTQTRLNIQLFLGDSIQADRFISKTLLIVLATKDVQGDIQKACQFILTQESLKYLYFTQEDQSYAAKLLKVLQVDYCAENIITKSKGTGVITLNPIRKNQFISKYLGQLLPTWRWYEKRNVISQKIKDEQMEIPDKYYHAILETHENEQTGRQIYFIDSLTKGNITRNINHSCNPNCVLVNMLSNGSYVLALYALRDISVGEELTLDLNATADPEYPHQLKDCLCSQSECGQNIIKKTLDHILESNHGYLRRNAILLQACSSKSSSTNFFLNKYNVGKQLNMNQQWLQEWLAQILNFVDLESKTLIKQLKNLDESQIQAYISYLKKKRIQNAIFSIDKVSLFQEKVGEYQPPLYILSNGEQLQGFWKDAFKQINHNGEQSIIQEIIHLLKKHNVFPQAKRLIYNCQSKLNGESQHDLVLTRLLFLNLSHIFLDNNDPQPFHHQALGIYLYLMTFTYTYFRQNQFKGFTGDEFDNSELGLEQEQKFKKKGKNSKYYTPQFIWGQLVGWFRQSLQNPQSSMAQERRGLLCYPSFLHSFDTKYQKYPYQVKSVDEFVNYFLNKRPSQWQPDVSTYSYKNTHNQYGSIFFENYFNAEVLPVDFLNQVLMSYNCDMKTKLQKFYQFEGCFCDESLIQEVQKIQELNQQSQKIIKKVNQNKQKMDQKNMSKKEKCNRIIFDKIHNQNGCKAYKFEDYQTGQEETQKIRKMLCVESSKVTVKFI